MKVNWNDERKSLEKLLFKEKKSYEAIGKICDCSGTAIKKD